MLETLRELEKYGYQRTTKIPFQKKIQDQRLVALKISEKVLLHKQVTTRMACQKKIQQVKLVTLKVWEKEHLELVTKMVIKMVFQN